MTTFEVTSGKINITDPCYSPDTWCAIFDLDAENGIWYADVEKYDAGDWGNRCARLVATHESLKKGTYETKLEVLEIGVDSGQAGIFDSSLYEDKHSEKLELDFDNPSCFYERCCKATLGELKWGTVDGKGVVSSSGYGDGGYDVYVFKKDGKVVAVEVIFIDPDLEDEEEDY